MTQQRTKCHEFTKYITIIYSSEIQHIELRNIIHNTNDCILKQKRYVYYQIPFPLVILSLAPDIIWEMLFLLKGQLWNFTQSVTVSCHLSQNHFTMTGYKTPLLCHSMASSNAPNLPCIDCKNVLTLITVDSLCDWYVDAFQYFVV